MKKKSVFTRKAIINVPFYVIMLHKGRKWRGGISDVKGRKINASLEDRTLPSRRDAMRVVRLSVPSGQGSSRRDHLGHS